MSADELSASTRLALQRTRLAVDRTLMAWVRTSLSLITFGFTIYKFFQFEAGRQIEVRKGLIGPRGFALFMIGIGLTALLLATVEHRRNIQGLRAEGGAPMPTVAGIVAALVGVLGVLGFVSVLLRF